ncbi:hypothetical protein FRA_50c14630 [Francisella sp. W12-1067]|nr:hypothetical protein FRA_50c14630 [Francisella sp. W12-1067]
MNYTFYFNGTGDDTIFSLDSDPWINLSDSREDRSLILTYLDFMNRPDKLKVYEGLGTGQGMQSSMELLFATNLSKYTKRFIYDIEDVTQNQKNEQITINLIGFSRGSITILHILKNLQNSKTNPLKEIPNLTLNVVLIDPVPGNYKISNRLDFLHQNTTNQHIDLSNINWINNVGILISSHCIKAMPFKPMIPEFHYNTKVTIDFYFGEHTFILYTTARLRIDKDDDVSYHDYYDAERILKKYDDDDDDNYNDSYYKAKRIFDRKKLEIICDDYNSLPLLNVL